VLRKLTGVDVRRCPKCGEMTVEREPLPDTRAHSWRRRHDRPSIRSSLVTGSLSHRTRASNSSRSALASTHPPPVQWESAGRVLDEAGKR
jgi:hypothetical protein